MFRLLMIALIMALGCEVGFAAALTGAAQAQSSALPWAAP